MFLPRSVYEGLPYAWLGGGALACLLSYVGAGGTGGGSAGAWSDVGLVGGVCAMLVGIVLLLRRRAFRADTARYDPRSLDDA